MFKKMIIKHIDNFIYYKHMHKLDFLRKCKGDRILIKLQNYIETIITMYCFIKFISILYSTGLEYGRKQYYFDY